MPKKTKAKQMPANFYDMEAFNEKDKKIDMKEVFGKNAPKKTNKQTKAKHTEGKKKNIKNNREKIKY